MTKAVMGTMLRALTKKPENPTDDPFDPEVEMKQGTAEAKDRERKALLLRAKLAQASAMQSEHEVQP